MLSPLTSPLWWSFRLWQKTPDQHRKTLSPTRKQEKDVLLYNEFSTGSLLMPLVIVGQCEISAALWLACSQPGTLLTDLGTTAVNLKRDKYGFYCFSWAYSSPLSTDQYGQRMPAWGQEFCKLPLSFQITQCIIFTNVPINMLLKNHF